MGIQMKVVQTEKFGKNREGQMGESEASMWSGYKRSQSDNTYVVTVALSGTQGDSGHMWLTLDPMAAIAIGTDIIESANLALERNKVQGENYYDRLHRVLTEMGVQLPPRNQNWVNQILNGAEPKEKGVE